MSSHNPSPNRVIRHHRNDEATLPRSSAIQPQSGEAADHCSFTDCSMPYRKKFCSVHESTTPESSPPIHPDSVFSGSSKACPHCQEYVTVYRFTTHDGLTIMTYHCDRHGDVVPSTAHSTAPDDLH